MKKILLSTLVLGTMSSFALAGEPAKLDESQLSTVAAGESVSDPCGCFTTPSFNLAAGSKEIFVGVKDEGVAVSQGGPGISNVEIGALVNVANTISATAASLPTP